MRVGSCLAAMKTATQAAESASPATNNALFHSGRSKRETTTSQSPQRTVAPFYFVRFQRSLQSNDQEDIPLDGRRPGVPCPVYRPPHYHVYLVICSLELCALSRY